MLLHERLEPGQDMKTLQKSINGLLLASLLLIVPGSAKTYIRAQTVETQTGNGANILTKDELYFGLSKPGGEMISEAEWQLFLRRVITPRFREGITVVDAYGQYLNSGGNLIKEKSKLVILIHENSQKKNQSIEEIIASYKQTFKQESVLRVTTSAKVSF